MSELVAGIPPLLAAHLELALVALAIAAALSMPLAIAIAERPRAAFVVVTVAGVVQTFPSLALLALMVPILAHLGVLSPFGFAPAVIALTLYAILPILRNAITGLRGVDPAAVEAARGMGMSRAQVMRLVQLPLAAPVIAAGIRTATVWTVGAATLATPVGQPCLGNYIFTGLQTRNFEMLLVGIAAAAALAVTLDGLLAATERVLAGRHRRRVWIPTASFVVLAIVLIGVLPRLPRGGESATATATTAHTAAKITHVRIGSKTFTEQYILGEVLRARLAQVGITAEIAQSLGSNVIFDALAGNDIDMYVEYSGTLWTNQMKRPTGVPRWQVLAELTGWLADRDVRSLGALGFENTYALAVRRDTADKLHLHSIGDLAAHPELVIGGEYEFFGRAEWQAVRTSYGLRFARQATFDPSLLYEAAARGEVDVISAFSSDGRIAANDLVVLDDPAGALPPYDAMILLAPRVASDRTVACALGSLNVDVEHMRQANARVDRDKQTPEAAARWLLDQLPAPACSSIEP